MAQPVLPLPEVTELNGTKALPTRAAIAGQRLGPTIRSAVGGARRLGAVGAAVGTAASLGDYKIDDPEVDSSAGGTMRAIRNGDFSAAGRSLSKGALEAGMDLGSAGAQTLDMVVPGTNTVSRAYGNMLRNAFGGQLIDNSGTMGNGGAGRGLVNPVMPTETPPAAPGSAPRTPFSDARMTAQTPALVNGVGSSGPYPTAPPTGNAPGTFRYANGSTGTGTVSTLNTLGVDGYNRQLANIRSLGGPSDSTVGQGAAGITSAPPPSAPSFSDLTHRGLSARQADASIRGDRQQALEREIATMREGTARAGNSQALQIAAMNNATSRDNNTSSNNVAMRGQDFTLDANRAGNRLAVAQAALAQTNKDRDFNQTQQQHDLAARSSSQKDLDEQLGQRFRMDDGKGGNVVDHNKVASYKAALQTTLPQFVELLKQSKTPQALAKAAELEKRGVSAMGPDDHAQLQQLFDTRELARETHGSMPGKSNYVHSDNLLDYRQNSDAPVVRGFTGRRVQTANGTTVDLDKIKYGRDGNSILPNFTPQNMNLTRGIRQEY